MSSTQARIDQLRRIQAALQASTDQAALVANPDDPEDKITPIVDDGYTAIAELQEMIDDLPSDNFLASVAHAYMARREKRVGQRGWKKGTQTDQARQLEFFLGAAAAAEHFGRPHLATVIAITTAIGRDCSEFLTD